jgi:MoaA/NifB/PqqE/SkfB family radical SAM enzyme
MRRTFKPKAEPMTLANIKRLLKRMPYISSITIQGLCEPYMNPECPAIIKWLKSEGYHISFTTNGMIPLTGERLDCLRCVDDFVISIDTSNPETFAFLRKGAKLETVMQNLERVVEMKRSLGLSKHDNPPLHINAVITSKNFHQMPGLFKMLDAYADDLTYLMVDPVSRPDYCTFEDPLALKHDNQFEKDILEMREIASKSKLPVVGLDYMLVPSTRWHDCPLPWLDLWVQPNGDIYEFYGFNNVFGNAFTEDPLKAHNSKKARAFRKQLLTDTPPLQQCHSCNFARSGWQLHGGYLQQSRAYSVAKPMTFYEAFKHVLTTVSGKGGYTF